MECLYSCFSFKFGLGFLIKYKMLGFCCCFYFGIKLLCLEILLRCIYCQAFKFRNGWLSQSIPNKYIYWCVWLLSVCTEFFYQLPERSCKFPKIISLTSAKAFISFEWKLMKILMSCRKLQTPLEMQFEALYNPNIILI